jgi:pimeloyl-ACP methyl ester carboxylesterase
METVPTVAIAAPTGQYWQWQQHSIHYVTAGARRTDRPPLLLVHGFGASTDHWRKNIADLSQDFEVWAIDLLGFGRSAKADVDYSATLWRDQVHDFIQDVIGQPTVLAGNSIGGYTVMAVAAAYPAAVQGLVLLNSVGGFPSSDPAAAETPKPDPIRQAVGKFAQGLFQQDWFSFLLFQYVRQKSMIRKTLEQVYLDKTAVTDQLVEEIYRPSCDPGAARVFALVFRAAKGDSADTLLAKMTCPLLALWGEGDPWMNARSRGAQFRQHYPTLTEYYLRSGHCPHDESPDPVNGLIRAWILESVLPRM